MTRIIMTLTDEQSLRGNGWVSEMHVFSLRPALSKQQVGLIENAAEAVQCGVTISRDRTELAITAVRGTTTAAKAVVQALKDQLEQFLR